jgi:hypothetical protein
MKIIRCFLAIFAVFNISSVVQAQASWTYVDGWWEIYSDTYQEDTIEQEGGFLLTMNGQLKLNAKVVTEVNPASNSHGFTHGVAINNVANNTTVAEKSDSYLYTGERTSYTTLVSYNVPITQNGIEGPFELSLIVAPTGCPESHCNTCGGGIGYFGASLLRYDFDHIAPDGKIWFVHYGNHCSYNCTNCTTYCGNVSWMREYWQVHCVGHECSIGSRVIVVVPWGPLGCLKAGLGVNHGSIPQCFDISYN